MQETPQMDIIPVPPLDQFVPIDNIRTRTFFLIDALLDESLLRASLERLIRNHWRKLGGRLVTRPRDRRLEYHVPHTFPPDHALFAWSSRTHDHSVDKVAPAAALRSPPLDRGPQFLDGALEALDAAFRPADWPFDRRGEPPDAPLLHVHLSLFADATVLAISQPHALMDQMGLANVLKAWMGVVRGREPPAFVGYEGDVLPGAGKRYTDYDGKEVFRKGRQRLFRPGEYPLILLPFLPDLMLHREKRSLLFFPLPWIRGLREGYARALAEEHPDFTRISDGDVMTALVAKLGRMNKQNPRVVALSQAINLRGRVPELRGPPADGFVHNALHTATARLRMHPATPARDIAWANRQAVEQALDPRDIELGLAAVREKSRRRQTSHVCEMFERSYHVTNWCAAWKDVDFGPAVAGDAGDGEGGRPGFFVVGQSKEQEAPLRFSSTITSRSETGYWVEFSASLPAWKLIEEHLARDALLDEF